MFKDRLKELRAKKQMTQDSLAKSIHVSRSAVCKWETACLAKSTSTVSVLYSTFQKNGCWKQKVKTQKAMKGTILTKSKQSSPFSEYFYPLP